MKIEEKLIEIAKNAVKNAHVPYLDFPVGAAVETETGELFSGCNIDNASTPLGICAERVAIFNAVLNGHKKIKRLAVTCPRNKGDKPENLMPCGACRQVMAEFMSPDAEIIVDGVGIFKLKDLLPSPFTLK